MPQLLRDGQTTFEIGPRAGRGAAPAFPDAGAAARFIRRFKSDPFAVAALRRLAAETLGGSAAARFDDHRLVEWIAGRVERGHFRITAPSYGRTSVAAAGGAAAPAESASAGSGSSSAPSAPPEPEQRPAPRQSEAPPPS